MRLPKRLVSIYVIGDYWRLLATIGDYWAKGENIFAHLPWPDS
jgi:hypothetical protein